MKRSVRCTNLGCAKFDAQDRGHIVKFGFYRRRCDSKRVQRFRCQVCKKTISNQTFNPTYRQKKPRINSAVANLLCSKVSMRQVGRLLKINFKTVDRRMHWHADQARLKQMELIKQQAGEISYVQMDEMETFEHTKCKPLSIALAVNPENRQILAAKVAIMPAKGRIAAISRKRYGKRPDQRKEKFTVALNVLKQCCSEDTYFLTDMKPAYRSWIKSVFPHATHEATKGRRGCVVGYGEMKAGGFDPLFCLNHTAAMIRDNLARMLRRTWCTTKKVAGLEAALDLYVWMHNQRLMSAGVNT